MYDALALLGFSSALSLISFAVSVVTYLLSAIGLYKMGKNLGLSNPWISFIPVANIYAFGRIAERYIKADGSRSARWSKILLILYIILIVLAFILVLVVVIGLIAEMVSHPNVNAYFESERFAATALFSVVIPMLLLTFAILGVSIAYLVVKYIALWRLYALYDMETATLFLVLSIIFSFLEPIFIFILRNRQPRVAVEQQSDIM